MYIFNVSLKIVLYRDYMVISNGHVLVLLMLANNITAYSKIGCRNYYIYTAIKNKLTTNYKASWNVDKTIRNKVHH